MVDGGRIVLVYGSLVVYEVHIYNRIRRSYSRIQVVSGMKGSYSSLRGYYSSGQGRTAI